MAIEVSVLQLVAYISLTLASITVTTVSAIFSYRQNFGWEPLLLLTNHGISMQGNSTVHEAIIDFEFWNRRKYPVVIRSVSVQFNDLELVTTPKKKDWHQYRMGFISHPDKRVDSASYEAFNVTQWFKTDSIDDLNGIISVEVLFTDPVSGKEVRLAGKRNYTFSD